MEYDRLILCDQHTPSGDGLKNGLVEPVKQMEKKAVS